ncbi:phosphoribosyltransferase [Desulfurococcus mucosus]|uniref:Phosphoribosyltransferase n=1 Tax=Desulfurococcus mucosus (strain ATCC 35584 / DSM 2162 / JCM 9187 / O7/1) TaxID=765177 RepID=E8R7P5_DESM0|nr:phosphoribosyltransferase [Desulfurococcus mucosus]ADV64540.1 phosphoribosyltransferase [Desulfurococcus mucosus DSM 2162]
MQTKVRTRYVAWRVLHGLLRDLATRINSGYRPDIIIAVAKGGLIPARILVDLLGVEEMGLIEVKFYKGVGEAREKPYVTFTALPPIDGKKLLVVDDIADSGRTLQVVADVLSRFKYMDLRFATLYVKPWSTIMPDYYGEIVEEWIVFPWEICEATGEGVRLEGIDVEDVLNYCVEKTGTH